MLIEYALNKDIDTVSEWAKSIDDTNFTFSQKIKICSILGLFIGEASSHEDDINLFNKIRNQIAHKLSYEHGLLTAFINRQKFVNDAILKFGDTPTDLKLLKGGIIYICGQIGGLIETRHTFDAGTRETMIKTVKDRKAQKSNDNG